MKSYGTWKCLWLSLIQIWFDLYTWTTHGSGGVLNGICEEITEGNKMEAGNFTKQSSDAPGVPSRCTLVLRRRSHGLRPRTGPGSAQCAAASPAALMFPHHSISVTHQSPELHWLYELWMRQSQMDFKLMVVDLIRVLSHIIIGLKFFLASVTGSHRLIKLCA